MVVERRSGREAHIKSWGHEEWIVNNEMYCGKRLHFDRAHTSTSLHFHMQKHETMYVEKGTFRIVVVDQETVQTVEHDMSAGDSLTIEPGAIHRIVCLQDDSVLVEFSTHHEDSDSYRVSR